MARVTVEDCLRNVENRFELIMLASKRARQLAMTAVEPRVNIANHKPTVIALMEIAEGHTAFEEFNEETLKKPDVVPYHHTPIGTITEGE